MRLCSVFCPSCLPVCNITLGCHEYNEDFMPSFLGHSFWISLGWEVSLRTSCTSCTNPHPFLETPSQAVSIHDYLAIGWVIAGMAGTKRFWVCESVCIVRCPASIRMITLEQYCAGQWVKIKSFSFWCWLVTPFISFINASTISLLSHCIMFWLPHRFSYLRHVTETVGIPSIRNLIVMSARVLW